MKMKNVIFSSVEYTYFLLHLCKWEYKGKENYDGMFPKIRKGFYKGSKHYVQRYKQQIVHFHVSVTTANAFDCLMT